MSLEISVEMSGYQADEITAEAKDQVAEICSALAKRHLEYKDGTKIYDIGTAEIRRTIERLNRIGGLIELIEDAKQKAKEEEKK